MLQGIDEDVGIEDVGIDEDVWMFWPGMGIDDQGPDRGCCQDDLRIWPG